MLATSAPVWWALDARAAWLLLLFPMLAWGVWRRRWASLLAAGLSVALADPLASRVLKPLFDRERPCRVLVLDGVDTCGAARAMPSTHATNTAALAAATGSPALAGVAVVVGVSRVVTGQHWPSDVVVGWAVGGLLGLGVRAGVARAARRRGLEPGSVGARDAPSR